jgi:hypothetical protein
LAVTTISSRASTKGFWRVPVAISGGRLSPGWKACAGEVTAMTVATARDATSLRAKPMMRPFEMLSTKVS